MIGFTRRHFLFTSGAWLGGSLLGLGASRKNTRSISILHTTDLHGHILPTNSYSGRQDVGGFARCASQIRTWRNAHPDSLLFDIGDLYQGSAVSHRNRGELMIRLLNQTGYDAWVPGNHDFDWGADVAAKRFAGSEPDVVCANLTESGRAGASFSPWKIKDCGGFRIGIIGLITPALATWLTPETLGPYAATDPTPALAKAAREARAAGAQAIVVLAHMGWKQADDHANPLRAVLETTPGIDLLLAGHTHQDQPSWMLGKTLCSQASYHGLHCGRVELHFDADHGTLVSATAETTFMDNSIPMDPAVLSTCQKELDVARQELERTIATSARTIADKGSPNQLATLFCQAFAASLGKAGHAVDGVLHGTFGTGGIEPGPITIADCWRLLPYENLLVTARIPARDLLEIIRESGKSRGPRRLLWPFTIQTDRHGSVSGFTREGKDVPPDSILTLAFNSYDSQSGGRSMPILHEIITRPSAQRRMTNIDTRTALIDHLATLQTL